MNQDLLLKELAFKAIRSSGSGGQHVNKTSSKVEVQFIVSQSEALDEEEKAKLINELSSKLTNDYRLILQCGETRSQHKNKEIVIQRLINILDGALADEKQRIKTRVPIKARKMRLKNKRIRSEKKENRRPPKI
ncbi:ribosome-associated protein [Flavobacteriaceae bacterium MAR_2010_188]|nr:ribosome-associated protein [Flavobacteriaceae bacterium MAR_2010_188]